MSRCCCFVILSKFSSKWRWNVQHALPQAYGRRIGVAHGLKLPLVLLLLLLLLWG
jgi:hypothetical protein